MNISSKFEDNENLYRAIREIFLYEDGSVSLAALKTNNGLSVSRGHYRLDEKVIEDMKVRLKFEGRIAKLSVKDCREAETFIKYCPSINNEYHPEIHDSESVVKLPPNKLKKLCDKLQLLVE